MTHLLKRIKMKIIYYSRSTIFETDLLFYKILQMNI